MNVFHTSINTKQNKTKHVNKWTKQKRKEQKREKRRYSVLKDLLLIPLM